VEECEKADKDRKRKGILTDAFLFLGGGSNTVAGNFYEITPL
jgi:hypothetical protein